MPFFDIADGGTSKKRSAGDRTINSIEETELAALFAAAENIGQSDALRKRLKEMKERKEKYELAYNPVRTTALDKIRELCLSGLPPKHIWIRSNLHWAAAHAR